MHVSYCSCPTPGCDLWQAVCAPVQAFFLGFDACSTYTHTSGHLGGHTQWPGLHSLTQWGNTQSGSMRCHEVALRACLGTSVKPHPSFLLLCSCLFTVLPVF